MPELWGAENKGGGEGGKIGRGGNRISNKDDGDMGERRKGGGRWCRRSPRKRQSWEFLHSAFCLWPVGLMLKRPSLALSVCLQLPCREWIFHEWPLNWQPRLVRNKGAISGGTEEGRKRGKPKGRQSSSEAQGGREMEGKEGGSKGEGLVEGAKEGGGEAVQRDQWSYTASREEW